MTTDSEPWPALQRKGNHVVVKLLVLAILAGLSFRLLFSRSDVLHPVPVSPSGEAEREASAESMATDVLGLEDDNEGEKLFFSFSFRLQPHSKDLL